MPDSPTYDLLGLPPQEVRAPASAADLAEELAQAAARGLGVAPWGGGTQMGLGNRPTKFDLALQTCKLKRLVEHSPADLTATVEAGMTLAALQEALRPHGQMVAIDAPLPQRATVGGILATAGAGPRRFSYGLPRDQVIGMKVAHPDGNVTKAGGKVVKNVAGYDVMKLYIGSLGTLGVIVEATFRLAPLPATVASVVARCDGLDRALRVIASVRRSPLQPLALDLLDPTAAAALPGEASGWLVAAEFGGGTAAVERQTRDAIGYGEAAGATPIVLQQGESTPFWQAVRDFGRQPEQPWLVLKATILPGQTEELVRSLFELAQQAGLAAPAIIARAGNGMVFAYWQPLVIAADLTPWPRLVDAARARAVALEGSLTVERAPAQLAGLVDPWGPPTGNFAIMRRLKELFDPQGVLNPGRYVGGL